MQNAPIRKAGSILRNREIGRTPRVDDNMRIAETCDVEQPLLFFASKKLDRADAVWYPNFGLDTAN